MAAVQAPPSLGPEDLKRIEEALQVLAKLPAEMDAREACGVDCQSYRSLATELRNDLEQLRKVFFPGRRAKKR